MRIDNIAGYRAATVRYRDRTVSGLKRIFRALLLSVPVTLALATVSNAETKFDYGADFRLRYEYWKGNFDMSTLGLDDENYLRLKVSLWSRVQLNKNASAYLKLTTEPKCYISSSSSDNKDLEQDEVFFESLYVDVRDAAGIPLDLRIGRQELRYGDGFLIADGTPVSADRTKYFNAARATWKITENNSLDLVYIYNTMTDQLLPVLHPAKSGRLYKYNQRILNSSDEEAFVIYGKNRIGDNLTIEPYYIYKQEERINAKTPTLFLNTIGTRAVYDFRPWELKAEYAHQFGEYDGGRKRIADGGSIFIRRSLENLPWAPDIEAGYVYLSGDDAGSDANEGWDPLFSRYKWMSALYKYAYSRETGIGSYWSNLGLYRFDMSFNFTPSTRLSLAYNYLTAIEKTRVTGPNAPMFSNSGKERGHLQQTVLSHKFDKRLGSLLTMEYFVPGNFYRDSAKDAFYLSLMMQVHL